MDGRKDLAQAQNHTTSMLEDLPGAPMDGRKDPWIVIILYDIPGEPMDGRKYRRG
jgi:hypothetical protein